MHSGFRVSAILVAAGNSTRMGFDKLAYEWEGRSVLLRSMEALAGHPAVDELIVVSDPRRPYVQDAVKKLGGAVRLVKGGATRHDSVRAGLQEATGDYVAIHDAARPFVSAEVIERALSAAIRHGAATPAVPVKDTVKIAKKDIVSSTPDRSTLFAVQTPQCFRREEYLELLEHTPTDHVTDDCSVYERAGKRVVLTQGSYANYKITTWEDLPVKKESEGMRIGHGYDVHRLVEGRKLILGGVEIPFEKGLLGHSDADVLTHAVMDALLGAAAKGDIGKLFPDNDPAYEGADSIELLRRVGKVLSDEGWRVGNIDATILCQRPKLAPHIEAMRVRLAEALGAAKEDISVKATTEEKLGFTGAEQGIAAHAVCLLTHA